ncbi:MAG TPA: hypothetical protein VGJ26_19695 [Pirellulales bacterium]|jgi:hypothetical protein
MATMPTQHVGVEHHHSRLAVSRAMAEAGCGVCAILLTIIGLAHAEWELLPSVATIAVGAALLLEGASAAARSGLSREADAVVSTEFLGGMTGAILGILALLHIAPGVLVSAASIVFGAALIVGSVASNRFHSFHTAAGAPEENTQFDLLPVSTFAASGAQALVGLAATVLGIIALLDQEASRGTLNLVALLAVGAATVLMSAATNHFARRLVQ